MNLLLKILLISLVSVFVQAETTIDSEGTCITSELLQKTHLSCVSCALKKMGRPVPDDHFLAMFGLIAREHTALFDDESPTFVSDGKTRTKNLKRRDLQSNRSQIKESKNGPIEFTARAVYQKNAAQLLLASGYCAEGKIKPKQKANYPNLISRINAAEYASGKQFDEKDAAFEEIGHKSASAATNDFFMLDKEKNFLELSFDDQKEFFKERRSNILQRPNESSDSLSGVRSCVKDIDASYVHTSGEDAYSACRAIFDGCEIGTLPREEGKAAEIHRKNGARVGGDWCAEKYKAKKSIVADKSQLLSPLPGPTSQSKSGATPGSTAAAAPLANVETATTGGDIAVDIDGKQLQKRADGWFLPLGAVTTRKVPAAVPSASKPATGFQLATPPPAVPAVTAPK